MMEKRKSIKSFERNKDYIVILSVLIIAIFPCISSAASANILANSGFELGTAPWIFYTNGAGTFLSNVPGYGSTYAGHATIYSQGTNVQLYQAGIVLEPYTQYNLRFKAYSNTGHDLSVSLQKHVSPFTDYGLSNYLINLGTSWGNYSIQFTTRGFSSVVADGRLMFWFAPYDAPSDEYFFDDVILSKVSVDTPVTPAPTPQPTPTPTGSILTNPGFEMGISPWFFYTNGAGTILDDAPGINSAHSGHINILQPGTNVQLYQKGITLESNTIYNLSYKAYSNSGHDISVSIQKHDSPYTNYGLSNYVSNLGNAWNDYSLQFRTSGFTGTINDARLMFWFAPYDASGDQYFIDDVILSRVSEGSSTPSPISEPLITMQPSGKTVTVGQTATFSVTVTGTAPLSYQWQKNSINIPGATGAMYTTPATTLSDNESKFRVIISNSAGSINSSDAILIVKPELIPLPNNQLILFDKEYTHSTTLNNSPFWGSGKAFSFFNVPSSIPSNLVTPINYAKGTLYQRIQVFTKPSLKSVQVQICLFQDSIIASKHACSDRPMFTTTGTYYANQSMTSLYQYYVIDWTRSLLAEMLVVKDRNGTPVDDRYGYAGMWDGSPDFSLYYPMKVHYTAIIVPAGSGQPVWP